MLCGNSRPILFWFQNLTTTFGALCEVPTDNGDVIRRLESILDESFPEEWRQWPVFKLVLEDAAIPDNMRNKSRFAIPSVSLAQSFYPESTHISERQLRKVHKTLLDLPLGRALIYSPRDVLSLFRSGEEEETQFLKNISPLRNLFLSRAELNRSLEGAISELEESRPDKNSDRLDALESSIKAIQNASPL